MVYDVFFLNDEGIVRSAFINITLTLLIKILQSNLLINKITTDIFKTDAVTIDIYDE